MSLNAAFEPLWIWLHRGHIVRRFCLFYALWLTGKSYTWASTYATALAEPTAQNVAMVAAVTAIPSALFAAALKFYNSGRAAGPVTDGAE